MCSGQLNSSEELRCWGEMAWHTLDFPALLYVEHLLWKLIILTKLSFSPFFTLKKKKVLCFWFPQCQKEMDLLCEMSRTRRRTQTKPWWQLLNKHWLSDEFSQMSKGLKSLPLKSFHSHTQGKRDKGGDRQGYTMDRQGHFHVCTGKREKEG